MKTTDDFVVFEHDGKKYKVSDAEVIFKDINTGEVKFRFPLPTSTFASFETCACGREADDNGPENRRR